MPSILFKNVISRKSAKDYLTQVPQHAELGLMGIAKGLVTWPGFGAEPQEKEQKKNFAGKKGLYPTEIPSRPGEQDHQQTKLRFYNPLRIKKIKKTPLQHTELG